MAEQKTTHYPQERRLATVLFADVQGFTPLAEQLDFETVSDLINEIVLRLDRVIEAHRGYIDKHLGDGVMAIWGAPFADDNDAEQAISAGLDMVRALDEYCASSIIPGAEKLKLRVGINSGQVFASYVGTRKEYTVLGDTVNLAARLQQIAEPGSVVIGENTFRMVRNNFRVARMEPTQVKGKTEPIQPYLVEAAFPASGRPRYQRLDSLETNMVGREKEMAQLLKMASQMQEGGKPVMVVLDGDVGMGKSRLLLEWANQLERDDPSYIVLSTRALAQTSQVPLYLWRVLVRNKFGLNNDDPAEVTREKWRAGLESLWGNEQTPNWAETTLTLGMVIGLNSDDVISSDQPVQQTFFLIREMLRRIGGGKTLIVIMEDLQWADRESLQLLQYILNVPSNPPVRLFIAAAARPEFLKNQPHWHSLVKVIRMEPLQFSPEMVANAYPDLKHLPAPILEQIGSHAEGNPYFLEEIVKSMVKSGMTSEHLEEAALEERLLAHIPESLRETIQARLDHLSREARTVALLASVVGRVFWVGAVLAAAQSTSQTGVTPLVNIPPQVVPRFVQDGLRQLVRAELAFPRVGTRYSDEQEYIFKNAFLRDVAYSMIPNRNRIQYHKAVAEWLETHQDSAYQTMAKEHVKTAERTAKIATGSLPPLPTLQT